MQGNVFRNKIFTGIISRNTNGLYTFQYDKDYLTNNTSRPISINIPLQEERFESKYLFPFFFNMLSEGVAKDIQCKEFRIDNDDDFARLLKTTKNNTIGSITVEERTI